MPRTKSQTLEADPAEEKARPRAPSVTRRNRSARAVIETDSASPDAVAAPEPQSPAATRSGDASTDIAGRPVTPPPAHGGWEAPSTASAPTWSFPTGVIAGRDKPTELKNQPLVAPINPSLGPEGRRRNPALVIALSVITLGAYALIWHNRINTEVGDFDTRMYVRAGRSTLAVAVAWAIGLLVSILGAALIVIAQMQISLPFSVPLSRLEEYLMLGGLLVVPYLMLVVPFCVVAVAMTIERVRIAEDRAGRTTDVQLRPSREVCWLAVPVIGGLVLIAVLQTRLNGIWEIAAPAPAARISSY